MASLHVSITDPMRDWVEARIASGDYANNSDYVRDLIRKDQERSEKLAAMQAAITEGIESGAAGPWDKEAFLKRMQENL